MASALRWAWPLSIAWTASALRAPAPERGDGCECLPWKEAFLNHRADCAHLGDEGCEKFFKRIPNETFCVNEDMHLGTPKQWCYVSSKCSRANDATWQADGNNKAARFRYCDKGERSLGEFRVNELRQWCKKHDLEFGLVVQFSYPTFIGHPVPDVVEFWDLEFPKEAPVEERAAEPLSLEIEKAIQAEVDSNRTMFIPSRGGHPPFIVLEGKKAYWVNFSGKFLKRINAGGDPWARPSEMNLVACVAGCEKNSEPWWTVANDWMHDQR
mmetsp:Transcript_98121/g.219835  ORF Transcript_98121/g.219835 Transcript_98121/m.219835 type:complete len:269 (-) Transcript_98121:24-830(-)